MKRKTLSQRYKEEKKGRIDKFGRERGGEYKVKVIKKGEKKE